MSKMRCRFHLTPTLLLKFVSVVVVVRGFSEESEAILTPEVVPQPSLFGRCPEVKPMPEFNIFAMLGEWFVSFYYSSSEESLTYDCMRVEFGLSRGYMDMRMRMTYRYANDPKDEVQTGNMTWQIPDPRRPEHWRHTEDPYRGIYNTDVIDTDYSTWLLLLHCSDPEPNKKFLSAFVLSRKPRLDKVTADYLKEKIGVHAVDLEYLFPVNQARCLGEEDLLPEMTVDNPLTSIRSSATDTAGGENDEETPIADRKTDTEGDDDEDEGGNWIGSLHEDGL